MNKYRLKNGRLGICTSECFPEASAAELRVLLALIERDFDFDTDEELAKAAHTSKSRAVSAVALFESSGIIEKASDGGNITYEFAENSESRKEPKTALSAANTIRDEGLALVIHECTALMNKAALSREETIDLTSLVTDEMLAGEYIAILTAYLSKRGKVTVNRIVKEAKKLKERGIDTAEMLEAYIKEREKSDSAEYEFKKLLHIWERPLSDTERAYATRWFNEYGYSEVILSKAYDMTVLTKASFSIRYMDTIVKSWFEAGCRTLDECTAHSESEKQKRDAENSNKPKRKQKESQPRYGTFDINKAFTAALERSYKNCEEEENKPD